MRSRPRRAPGSWAVPRRRSDRAGGSGSSAGSGACCRGGGAGGGSARPRGGVGIDQHLRAAEAVLQAGGVFVQMPEGTVSGPVGRIGSFRTGAALIALRTGAPIVPLAMAGTEELYLGRRMAARILSPPSARGGPAATRGGGRP